MGFTGPVVSGTPRMDVIINPKPAELKKRVCDFLGVDEKKKILAVIEELGKEN